MAESLPEHVRKRNPPALEREELVRLVKWKVGLRGKWRPRLQDYAAAIPAADIERCTREALRELGDGVPRDPTLKQALKIVTELKVGCGRRDLAESLVLCDREEPSGCSRVPGI